MAKIVHLLLDTALLDNIVLIEYLLLCALKKSNANYSWIHFELRVELSFSFDRSP